MSTVTNIQQVKWQRHADEQSLKSLDAKIKDAENALVVLLHHPRELVNRLDLNKLDGPEVA
ncbi:hypothetical protein LNS00_002058 [Escherichia coli]|uniref:hypothetical protein n=1 Tax=Escherichia coli TaxID=562 RepID=UPI000BB449D2|nr:hypothetical protein [Escherichia coli]ELP4994214.1 hypothetical protein [Salmonella enterica subsp. enterica serovar Uganda]EEU9521242.1 hypothetical protein [Escherichia coli]EEV6962963.1 hypothetical protein [Escherichia coli]EEW1961152.1 hypothetical protein [Escherichia coli]EEW2044682.1 hypothetical protein [Escherichia coli]